MKLIIKVLLLICYILIINRCSNSKEEIPPPTSDCCINISFIENYYLNFPDDNVFFIKGGALDLYEYGRNIIIYEDLKGNFNDKSNIFVWGGGNPPKDGGVYITIERTDNLGLFNKNDTLIMLVQKILKKSDYTIEKPGEYTTLGCACSVLKLSNGYVTGRILPYWEKKDLWWINMSEDEFWKYIYNLSWDDSFSEKDETMTWEEFQKILETINESRQ